MLTKNINDFFVSYLFIKMKNNSKSEKAAKCLNDMLFSEQVCP